MCQRWVTRTLPGMSKQRFITTALVVGAVALAATAFAASTRAHASSDATSVKPTSAALSAARDRVEQWLGSVGFAGFRVSEVMAFSTNDYVAINNKNGKPAFELLMAPNRSWLMEEPPSMMWGGGMMGSPSNWYSRGTGKVTSLNRAAEVADTWLAKARPGEKAETDGRAFPGYYTFDTTRKGKTAGMLSVNASTGAVWYHGWHGTFSSERMFES